MWRRIVIRHIPSRTFARIALPPRFRSFSFTPFLSSLDESDSSPSVDGIDSSTKSLDEGVPSDGVGVSFSPDSAENDVEIVFENTSPLDSSGTSPPSLTLRLKNFFGERKKSGFWQKFFAVVITSVLIPLLFHLWRLRTMAERDRRSLHKEILDLKDKIHKRNLELMTLVLRRLQDPSFSATQEDTFVDFWIHHVQGLGNRTTRDSFQDFLRSRLDPSWEAWFSSFPVEDVGVDLLPTPYLNSIVLLVPPHLGGAGEAEEEEEEEEEKPAPSLAESLFGVGGGGGGGGGSSNEEEENDNRIGGLTPEEHVAFCLDIRMKSESLLGLVETLVLKLQNSANIFDTTLVNDTVLPVLSTVLSEAESWWFLNQWSKAIEQGNPSFNGLEYFATRPSYLEVARFMLKNPENPRSWNDASLLEDESFSMRVEMDLRRKEHPEWYPLENLMRPEDEDDLLKEYLRQMEKMEEKAEAAATGGGGAVTSSVGGAAAATATAEKRGPGGLNVEV